MPSISRIQKSGDRPRTSRVYATSSRTTLTGPDVEAGLLTPTMRLPQRTSWERPRRVDAGARFTRAMRKRAHGPSGHSDVVRGERLAPELGDARLRARKEKRAAGAEDDRRRASCMETSSQRVAAAFPRMQEWAGPRSRAGGRSQVVQRGRAGLDPLRARSRSGCGSGGFPFEDPSPRHVTGRVLRDTRGWGLRERRPYVQAECP